MSKVIINVETGKVTQRELNASEISQQELDEAESDIRKAKAAAREASRQAILDKLGITAEEAQLLLS